MKTLADYGVSLRSASPGEYKTFCPRCTPTRKNKHDRSLSVKIETSDKFVGNCHNCGFVFSSGGRGSTKGEPTRERPSWKTNFQKYKW